jgi:parallel beta-helix repeat protein
MTTYYVSSEIGSANNAGTSASAPLDSLQAAANLVKPGDTVQVMNGTYTGTLNITTSGTAGAPITFEAAPGQNPILDNSGDWNAINVQASYINIKGFTVQGDAGNYNLSSATSAYSTGNPAVDGNGIAVTPGGSTSLPNHVTIENNTVTNEPGGGIYTEGADYVQILNNTVSNNAHWSAFGNSGISVSTSQNMDNNAGPHIVISGNTAFGNAQMVPTNGAGKVTDGEGIILDTNPGYTGQVMVQNNTSYNNGGPGIESFLTDGATISGNTVYGNNTQHTQADSDSGIFINQSNNNTVADNGTTASGLTVSGSTGSGGSASTGTSSSGSVTDPTGDTGTVASGGSPSGDGTTGTGTGTSSGSVTDPTGGAGTVASGGSSSGDSTTGTGTGTSSGGVTDPTGGTGTVASGGSSSGDGTTGAGTSASSGSVTDPAGGTGTVASGGSSSGDSTTGTGTGASSGSVTDPTGGTGTVASGDTTGTGTGTIVGTGASGGVTAPQAPAVTIANPSLSVSPGQGVDLGLSVTLPNATDNVSVNVQGLPGYETITDKLDNKTFSGGNVTLTAAEVNSGLTLNSSYEGNGHPTSTLTVTATDQTNNSSSAAQSIAVTDPVSTSATGTSGSGSTDSGSTASSGSSSRHGWGHHFGGGRWGCGHHSEVSHWFDSHPGFAKTAKTLSDAFSSKSGASAAAGSSTNQAASAGDKAFALFNQMMAGDFGNNSHFTQGGSSSAHAQQQTSNQLTRPLH